MDQQNEHPGADDTTRIPATQDTTPPIPPAAAATPPPPPSRQPLPKRVLAGLAAAVVVAFGGGYAVSAVQGDSNAEAATRGMPRSGGLPGGSGPDSRDDRDGDGVAGPMGPVDGEQHVTGTISSVGRDSITVKASDGSTATYSVTSTTQILDDGASVALSDLAKGTDVLVHVIPADSGAGTAERILAGSSAQDFAPPSGRMPGAPGSDDSDSGTTSGQDTGQTT